MGGVRCEWHRGGSDSTSSSIQAAELIIRSAHKFAVKCRKALWERRGVSARVGAVAVQQACAVGPRAVGLRRRDGVGVLLDDLPAVRDRDALAAQADARVLLRLPPLLLLVRVRLAVLT